MKHYLKDTPKFTINTAVMVISIIESISLFTMFSFEGVIRFFQTGIPEPSVCGPLLLIWAIICILYLTDKVESPKLSTVFALVFVYFGTTILVTYSDFGLNFPTIVHLTEAYIGYGYFIESAISNYYIWKFKRG